MQNKELNIFQSRITAKHKNICFVALDAVINILYFSKAAEKLGFSPDAVMENTSSFLNFIHPGDTNYFLANLDSDLTNPFDRTILKYRFRPSPEASYTEVHNVVYQSQAASLTGGKAKMYSSYLAVADSSDLSDFLLDVGEMEYDIRMKYSFDKMLIPAIMTQDFHITYANAEAAKFSDRDIETLHGISVFDIISKNDQTHIRKMLTGHYKKSTASKYCSSFKKNKDTVEIDIISFTPNTDTKPTSLALFFDASENIAFKNLLTTMYKSLDEIDQAIAVFSLNHEIEWVNRTFSTVTGYTPQEALGKKAGFLTIYNNISDKTLWKNIREKGYWEEVVIHRRKNGQGYPAKIRITGLKNEHGLIIKYIAFFQDITQETANEK